MLYLGDKTITRPLLRLAWPIIIANLLGMLYNLVDTFWVGRIGAEAVAAVSLSFPILFVLISLGGGIGVAGTILVAQYKGDKDKKQVNYISSQVIVAILLISIVLSIIGFLISAPVMQALGAETTVLPDAISYLQISFFGFIFFFLFMVFQGLMRGVGDVKLPMYIILASVILNLILDPIFILGFGPIPAYGVNGAAIVTVFTQFLSAIAAIIILFSGKREIHITLPNMKPNFTLIKKMFILGFPASMEQTMRSFGFTILIFLVAGFGTMAIAAYGIGTRISTLVILPALGLAAATTALAGQAIGSGDIDRAEKIAKASMSIAFIILSVIAVFLVLFAEPLSAFFIPGETEAIAASADFIRIWAFTVGFVGMLMVINGAFKAAGKTFMAMLLALISIWIFRIPLAYLLAYHTPLGLNGIWWAFPIANMLIFVTATIMFWKGLWKADKLTEKYKTKIKI
ncbi:MATE family efflux transporter [archaeon]|nr:MATE family efflux transporter [archaeon]